MTKKTSASLLTAVALGLASSPWLTADAIGAEPATLLAFPGAEGYGKYTRGGRGGKVYEVTNLNDAGPGSLREAVEATEARTVVFRVSGTIALKSRLVVTTPFLTIAGQTAPGEGITIRDYPLIIAADDVIVRFIRVRLGEASGTEADALTGMYHNNLIIDHVSASWSVDETLSVYHGTNVTVQWSIISESLFASQHRNGTHSYGGIWGSNFSTFHHNLIAHHSSRNPRIASGAGNVDFRNNVIYNWGFKSTYGGEVRQVNNPKFSFTNVNIVANYYKPGPATTPGAVAHQIANPWSRDKAADYGKWYVADNVVDGNAAVTADNWNGGVQPEDGPEYAAGLRLMTPWPSMPIRQQTAEAAFTTVLENAGATLPRRDSVDVRVVEETLKGFATYEGAAYEKKYKVADSSRNVGIIDTPSDVGGWPELKSESAPLDTDRDGMPDAWETAQGLDPKDPADRNKIGQRGYTMLEVYLHQMTKPSNLDMYE